MHLRLSVSLDHMLGHYCEAGLGGNSNVSLKTLQLHSIDAFPLLNYAFSLAYALDVFVLAICLVIFLT